jgi:hypothetical protein
MEEIKSIKNTALDKWLIIGDFNLIYRAEDKNNNRLRPSSYEQIQADIG